MVLTGPRRAGKTVLLQRLRPTAGYRLIEDPSILATVRADPATLLGPIWEGFVAAEILKTQTNLGRRRELYYFRDQQGLEVDFLVPAPNARLRLVEAKAGRTVTPAMAKPLRSLGDALGDKLASASLIPRLKDPPVTRAVAPGGSLQTLAELTALIARD